MPDVLYVQGRDADVLERAPFVALPIGSIEYHGPHAPLGTDTTLAAGFASRIAEPFAAVVVPPIVFSLAPSTTRNRRGTMSVGAEPYLAYVTDVLRSLVRNGVTRVLLVNGHSENQFTLRLASETLAAESPAVSCLYLNWWKLAAGEEELFSDHGGHGHGGPLEISVTAAFDSRGVDASAAVDVPYEAPWWRGAAQVVGRGQAPVGFDGYHGRVSEIEAAKGRRLLDQVVDRGVVLVKDWLARAE